MCKLLTSEGLWEDWMSVYSFEVKKFILTTLFGLNLIEEDQSQGREYGIERVERQESEFDLEEQKQLELYPKASLSEVARVLQWNA